MEITVSKFFFSIYTLATLVFYGLTTAEIYQLDVNNGSLQPLTKIFRCSSKISKMWALSQVDKVDEAAKLYKTKTFFTHIFSKSNRNFRKHLEKQ